jgi:hypothetical protein
MADEKPKKPEETPKPTPEGEKKESEMELAHQGEHPMPMLHGGAATPPVGGGGPEERMTATYSGFGGFVRLACYVLTRRVNLTRMKATLLSLQKDREDACVALGRRALEMKLSHAEIAPLASQIEALDSEMAAQRDQIRAVEAEPISDDPQIRKAEMNLHKVKTDKLNEAIQALEAKARSPLAEIAHIVHREKMEPQGLEPYYARIQAANGEIAAQEQRINETNEEYEAVSPGTRTMAYGFWGVVALLILTLLLLTVRACSSSSDKKAKTGMIPNHTEVCERLG